MRGASLHGAVREQDSVYEYYDMDAAGGFIMPVLLFVYLFVVTIVLVNLLIAQMSARYEEMSQEGPDAAEAREAKVAESGVRSKSRAGTSPKLAPARSPKKGAAGSGAKEAVKQPQAANGPAVVHNALSQSQSSLELVAPTVGGPRAEQDKGSSAKGMMIPGVANRRANSKAGH